MAVYVSLRDSLQSLIDIKSLKKMLVATLRLPGG